jgi:C-terminal processing protease CtpA/Prc
MNGSGIEVSDVTKDGISDKAGVLKGDHVVKFNKEAIKTRAGEEKTLFLKLGSE